MHHFPCKKIWYLRQKCIDTVWLCITLSLYICYVSNSIAYFRYRWNVEGHGMPGTFLTKTYIFRKHVAISDFLERNGYWKLKERTYSGLECNVSFGNRYILLTQCGLVTQYGVKRTWSTLVQVMPYCLTTASYFLNEYWLIISELIVSFTEGQ